jgi:hypothetical protein
MIEAEGIGHVLHICARIAGFVFEVIVGWLPDWTPTRRQKRHGRQGQP